jgi:MOSC domain-containing protein YiiM
MEMCVGELLGIAWRSGKRAPMQLLDSAPVTLEAGVGSDFRGRPGARQVTVLSREAWARATDAAGVDLPWQARRANLCVAGLNLENSTRRRLRIGSDVLLEITGELEPCERMDEAHEGLRQALEPDWRGGVTCRVLAAGRVAIGDPVRLESPPV